MFENETNIDLKILYATDLHGDERKYNNLREIALREDVDVIVNGGDLYPGVSKEKQKEFINRFLRSYIGFLNRKNIYYLALPGNYDLKSLDYLFDKICDEFNFALNINSKKIKIKGYDFIGMNLVSDYPFRLKDRCRMDTKSFEFPPQHGGAIFSTEEDFREMSSEDWFRYAKEIPSLEEELENLPKGDDPLKTIYVIHMPPANLGLDVCHNNLKVGSIAIYEFLKKKQPILSLHGHIHESPEISGIWKAKLGRTTCIQPGQGKKLIYVVITFGGLGLEIRKEEV
ncbi:MAG: metallophosphoesterase [candidate division WOR-3 bacterium]